MSDSQQIAAEDRIAGPVGHELVVSMTPRQQFLAIEAPFSVLAFPGRPFGLK